MSADRDATAAIHDALAEAGASELEQGHLPIFGDLRMEDVLDSLYPLDYSLGVQTVRLSADLEGGDTAAFYRSELSALPHDPTNNVHRAVVTGFLFRAIMVTADLYQTTVEGEVGPFSADAAAEYDKETGKELGALREYLDCRPVAGIADESVLLWELHAAGMARHTDRVIDICDHLTAGKASAENLSTAIRCLFYSLTGLGSALGPAAWVQRWAREEDRSVWQLNTMSACISYGASLLDDVLNHRPTRLPEQDREALKRLRMLLERLGPEQFTLEQQAIAGWAGCREELGVPESLRIAAANSFKVLGEKKGLSEELLKTLREPLLRAIAACYLRAGRSDLAEHPLKERLPLLEQKESALLHLAQCYHLQNKESETIETFERYVRESGDNRANDFTTTLALDFGLRAIKRGELHYLLATAAMAAPGREQGELLTGWMEPFYAKLSDQARAKWWTGLNSLSLPSYRKAIGDQVWNQAGTAFAEAVNIELRRRVIRPFFIAHPEFAEEGKAVAGAPRHERLVSQGRGTLGQHIILLTDSRYPNNPRTKAFSAWIGKHAPALSHFVGHYDLAKLTQLNELRGRAVHDDITEPDARFIFEVARDLMRPIVA